MDRWGEELNRFLVEVFNDILKTEERHAAERFSDLSLRELHLIEEVCQAVDQQRDNRSTAIAAAQRVTAGTLTTVVNQLERKGYLLRRRDELDKRAVRLYPTEKGREANQEHLKFHREMVEGILSALEPEEISVFNKALTNITGFFHSKYLDKA
ncbi:MAG: MarR family transcriptional regulator [Oscillospiraceae bacterium]|nr:MarR family transcriptional regulator [Oscillospiraceae bacterium]